MAAAAFATCLSTFVVALTGALRLPNNVDTVHIEALLELGSHRHLQALMSNMTAEAALAKPPSMPAELQAFVRQQLGSSLSESSDSQVFLQARTSKLKVQAESQAQLNFASMDADQARVVLNKMALDTMSKLDIQRAACLSTQGKQKQLLDETSQDVSSFNAQGTSARAQVMATQSAIKRLEELLPRLNQELALHQSKCQETRATLKKQIELIKKDTSTLKEVSSMASCDSLLLQTGLVHCHTQRRGKHHSFVAFKHHALRHKAAQLKSPTMRKALQTALLQVTRHHHRQHHGHSHREERSHHHGHHHHKKPRWHDGRHGHARHHDRKHLALLSQNARTKTTSAAHAGEWPSTKGTKCVNRGVADCGTVRDKLMFMQAGAADDIDGRYADLAHTEEDCKVAKKNLQDQIQATSQRLTEQQEMLAEATTIMINAGEQTRLKGRQLDNLEAEHTKLDSFCHDSVNQAALQLCKIKSIRQELFKMGGSRPFIQDCEVSAWTPEPCSKPCGGGVQNLVRQVVVPNSQGAACPPLSMQVSCNAHECPVDCDMGSWSGWTACSANCGGGIKQRIRHVNRRSQHGGKLCGAEAESVSCAETPCDKDCTLSTWSSWSTCSRACGGGFQERARRVVIQATGMGRCPTEDDHQRLEFMRCNPAACTPATPPLLKCAAKVDVIILLDSSGSLGKPGWDAMKAAGQSLVKAMDPNANDGNGAQVAVLVYSGPKNMNAYKKCTGLSADKVDMLTDCQMSWVEHFTTNTEELAGKIDSIPWRKGSTMTSQALATAEAELVSGRADAESVVIVLADQLPMMPRRTGQVAAALRKKARLIWAVATEAGPGELAKFASWASRPVADNVVYAHTAEDLAKDAALNKIIATACPKVA
jgi:hypothetical protein